MQAPPPETAPPRAWYHGVTRYQWLVVIIASAGWIFDAFEGQLFNITRNQMLADILHVAPGDPAIRRWGDIFLGVFLVGGTFGGILFGWLGDRWGRKPTMVLTILFYSIFSGLTYFADELWQVGVLRFLVAMGVGGEWAVAAALVAEVVPRTRARAHVRVLSFHEHHRHVARRVGRAGRRRGLADRVSRWRRCPRCSCCGCARGSRSRSRGTRRKRKAAAGASAPLGSFRDLLLNPRWARRAISRDAARRRRARDILGGDRRGTGSREGLSHPPRHARREADARKRSSPTATSRRIGSGLGMLSFGPLAVRFGRRRTFVFYHLAALVVVPITCFAPTTYGMLLALLPLYGFLTIGIHAGYAVYFPELFPESPALDRHRLLLQRRPPRSPRSMLVFSGWLKALPGVDLPVAISLMSSLFLLGLVIIAFMPETKDQPLPE